MCDVTIGVNVSPGSFECRKLITGVETSSISDPQNNWVPRRGDQGPKTIDQIHKEAELEEHREHIKVQQQLLSKKDGGGGARMGGNMGGRGPHMPGGGRVAQAQDEGWNTVPISKNRPIDTTRLSKITKVMSKTEVFVI